MATDYYSRTAPQVIPAAKPIPAAPATQPDFLHEVRVADYGDAEALEKLAVKVGGFNFTDYNMQILQAMCINLCLVRASDLRERDAVMGEVTELQHGHR